MATSDLAAGFLGGFALVPAVPAAEGALVAGATWVGAKSLAAAGALTVAIIAASQAAGIDMGLVETAKGLMARISADPADSVAWSELVKIATKVGGYAKELGSAITSGTEVVKIAKPNGFQASLGEYVETFAMMMNVSHDRALAILLHLLAGNQVGLTYEALAQYRMDRQLHQYF